MDELNKKQDSVNTLDIDELQTDLSKIALVEERLNTDFQKVESGTVQIHKKVVLEQLSQEVPVVHEELQVERVAMNQYVDAAPSIRYECDTTIISVVKEVLVVE